MARLRVETGKSTGKIVECDKHAVIGRGETAQLQILDLKASREHCRVFEQAGSWAVADLNSRNGIKVNGVQTTRKTLVHGDRIEIGETVVVFEVTGAAETGDSVPPVKGAAKTEPAAAKPATAAPARPSAPAAPAPRPAAAAPSKPSPPSKPGDASSKKAAAMAAARADAEKAKAGAAKSAAKAAPAASGAGDSGVKISDRALQFHKVDGKSATVLDVDLTQSAGTTKFLIFLGCAAFLGVLVWIFSTLTE